jgi:hypothetical protein
MKQEIEIFTFLCVLIIISSLVHLYLYNKCQNENAILKSNIGELDSSNDKLYQKYAEITNKIRYLRNISGNIIVNNKSILDIIRPINQ